MPPSSHALLSCRHCCFYLLRCPCCRHRPLRRTPALVCAPLMCMHVWFSEYDKPSTRARPRWRRWSRRGSRQTMHGEPPPPHPFRRGGWGVPVNRRRTYVLHAEAGECRRDRRCRVKNPMPKKKTMLGLMAPQTVDEGTDQGNVNGRFARREKTRRQRWCLPSPATPTTVALSSHSILCGAADVR